MKNKNYFIQATIIGTFMSIAFCAGMLTGRNPELVPPAVVEKSTTNELPYWDRPENQEELKKIGLEHEASKAKWLAENPPVAELFNEDEIYNTEYVIEYLKKNKIGGHCALVWRVDVVCVDFNSLTFPTSRK